LNHFIAIQEEKGHKRDQIVIPIVDVNGHILIGYDLEKILAYYKEDGS